MAHAALEPASLMPPPSGGLWRSALLALLAHALLVGALTLGLNWRLRTPDAVYAAELWAAVPTLAAPAAVQPPPAPVAPPAPPPTPRVETRAPTPPPPPQKTDAQIAIEQAERQKKLDQAREAEQRRQNELRQAKEREEKARQEKQARLEAEQRKAEQLKAERLKAERLEAEKRKQEQLRREEAEKREAQAAEKRLAEQREANLARIRGLAGATGAPSATGSASHDAAPSAAYAGRIKARIKPNIVLPTDVSGNPVTEVEVRCAPDGTIIGRRIVKSSGNDGWDDTVLRAIDRTGVLPRDVDGRVPSTMLLVFPRRE